jgi:hypothetical protein
MNVLIAKEDNSLGRNVSLQRSCCPWSVVLSGYSGFFPSLKLVLHDIAEMFLKVALNTKIKSNHHIVV